MDPNENPLHGIRREELRVFFRLFPVFRRYMKDRRSARSDKSPWSYERENNAKKAVEAFISLGPTFIKLGQVLSARSDLLPREYLTQFEKLQDDVPAAPFVQVRKIIERNVGKIEDVFENFDEKAISGASLGIVYVATYRGRKVALKVNRPDITNILKRDLVVVKRLLKLARNRVEGFLYISVKNVVDDFDTRIFDEIDYRKEAANMERIRKNIAARENVIIPEVIPEISSTEVLALEYQGGTKITDIEGLKKNNIDLQNLAYRLDLLFMRMLLRDDVFHADPHPGNISVRDDGRLVIYDYGMVGTLDEDTRFSLLSLYDGLANSNPDSIIDALLSLNALSPAANRGIIRRSMELAIADVHGKNVKESEIRELLGIANDVIFEFPFRLPRSLVLYMRMSSLLEGVCLQLDPDFKFVKVLMELLQREGLLDELYKKQLQTFARKSIQSIESGLDVLPLLKRRLEESDMQNPPRRSMKIPVSIFLGFFLIGSFYLMRTHPEISYILIVLDLLLFVFSLTRKKWD